MHGNKLFSLLHYVLLRGLSESICRGEIYGCFLLLAHGAFITKMAGGLPRAFTSTQDALEPWMLVSIAVACTVFLQNEQQYTCVEHTLFATQAIQRPKP